MTEQYKYEIIKKLIESNGNKNQAALKLDCSKRHINRMIQGYKSQGKSYFIHGNRGKQPVHALPSDVKQIIIDLYKTKYYDANFTHYSELLLSHESLSASPSTVRNVLMAEGILSPKATRSTKKKVRLELEARKRKAKSTKELDKITETIVNIEAAHPRRPRCAFFGEMLQMDASIHLWFGTTKTQLHIAVDDSTGMIVGAYFDEQETLKGYYNVFHQILKNYGIPYMFYTDRRTVFEYKQKKSPSIEEDTFTQFGYACKQLGVEIKTTSNPQAKGRVERMFQTLQSRLPLELRLAGVTTIEQANVFLNSYIKEYNAKFALPINHNKSVFEKQPTDEKINLILAVLAQRKIDNGHSIRFEKKHFKPMDSNGYPVYYHKGTNCMVIKAFDGNLFTCIDTKVYAMEEIPVHEYTSRNFDFPKTPSKPRKRYVPPMSHPWKQYAFSKHLNSQKHRDDMPFESLANTQALIY
jgi:transposase